MSKSRAELAKLVCEEVYKHAAKMAKDSSLNALSSVKSEGISIANSTLGPTKTAITMSKTTAKFVAAGTMLQAAHKGFTQELPSIEAGGQNTEYVRIPSIQETIKKLQACHVEAFDKLIESIDLDTGAKALEADRVSDRADRLPRLASLTVLTGRELEDKTLSNLAATLAKVGLSTLPTTISDTLLKTTQIAVEPLAKSLEKGIVEARLTSRALSRSAQSGLDQAVTEAKKIGDGIRSTTAAPSIKQEQQLTKKPDGPSFSR